LPPAPFSLFREELRRAWRELRGSRLSPLRGAAAVAIGLFVGSQPIFGLHTLIVLGLCVWFQLDFAVAWVASNISNPFFAPALLTAEVQVGGYLRTGVFLRLDREAVQPGALWHLAGYLAFGAPLVGLALAVLGGGVTWGAVRLKRRFSPAAAPPAPYRLPANAPPWVQAVERVATRYAPPAEVSTPAERTRFHYVRTKLLGDPVARLIADVGGEAPGALGEVCDLGTGRGQLPILLLELGRATSARGVDWDAKKVADAARAASPSGEAMEPLAATFTSGDVRAADPGSADTVLLIDVLHYLSVAEQDEVLRRAASAVRPGGRLLVREADTERGWRSRLTLLEERLFTALRFNRGERVRFRSAKSLEAVMEAEGLSCEVRPAWGKTPFANVLLIGTRAA
jgi:uncharacterized protein (DUF2062 family)/2-polyprenyl-3-methyl-5-hydroxy-6-metoxy-1,4-benzoquinol methylase